MNSILLLYDTEEKDLARDFKDLFDEINIGSIVMIPLSANKGFTLEEKVKSTGKMFFEGAADGIDSLRKQ